VLLFDLDRLRQINDEFGHAVGDVVLRALAGTAKDTLGGDTLFGRIGGDEFACCMPVGDMDEAYAIADRVRRNFATAARRYGNDSGSPTVSVGVTVGTDLHATILELFSIADRALIRAKELGRNRVESEGEDGANIAAPSIVPIIGRDRALVAAPPKGRRWRTAS
jgi:diguanylate cyclase (GGDEF)-like protein